MKKQEAYNRIHWYFDNYRIVPKTDYDEVLLVKGEQRSPIGQFLNDAQLQEILEGNDNNASIMDLYNHYRHIYDKMLALDDLNEDQTLHFYAEVQWIASTYYAYHILDEYGEANLKTIREKYDLKVPRKTKHPPKVKPTMTPIGEGIVYETLSSSNINEKHITVFDAFKQTGVCTCRGYRSHQKCWHVTEAAERNTRSDAFYTVDDEFMVSLGDDDE